MRNDIYIKFYFNYRRSPKIKSGLTIQNKFNFLPKMNRLGLIFATGALLVACWTTTVSSRSLDVISESDASDDLSPLNAPALLEFEGGEGDDSDGVREKRTPRFIFRTVSCLFTFLINPSCLQGITGGGAGGGGSSGGALSSYGSNRRQQSATPYYMISLPRFNDTDNNGTATEYPIYPIESTSEYPEEPPRPMNPIMQLLQWKMNLIPNMLRRFFPGFGGGRRDDGGSGGGGGLFSMFGGGGAGGNGLFANLGLGQGRLAGLFGGRQGAVGGGGLGGLGGLGFGGGGGQY